MSLTGEVPHVLGDGSVLGVPGVRVSEEGIEGVDHYGVVMGAVDQSGALRGAYETDIDAYYELPTLAGLAEAHSFLDAEEQDFTGGSEAARLAEIDKATAAVLAAAVSGTRRAVVATRERPSVPKSRAPYGKVEPKKLPAPRINAAEAAAAFITAKLEHPHHPPVADPTEILRIHSHDVKGGKIKRGGGWQ
ncbi:MAG TPA: hypothetical protein VG604_01100 [Candidatus Saccharimonadales bacterium]|nr:hypothetical protein [Candidatus Saccharimonadales bacterium]